MTRLVVAHAGNMYGGTERVLETLAQAARWSVDLEPHFSLCFEGQLAETLRQLGASVDVLGHVRLSRPDRVLRARQRFAAVLRARAVDAVMTQSEWSHFVFAPVVRKLGLPLVLWAHDAGSAGPLITKLAARYPPDWVVCNSLHTQRAIRAFFPSAPSSVILYPVVFDDRFPDTRADVRRRYTTRDDSIVIVNVARMESYKGQHVLVDALRRMDKRLPWTCWLVGGPQRPQEREYERSLRDAVDTYGLGDRVLFLGQQRDARSLLGAADIYCHPNQTAEAFGLSIIEALQAGLPVVASSLGGPSEIVTPACGRLVPAGNAVALADALATLVTDGRVRRDMAAAGPGRAWGLCNPKARLEELAHAVQHLAQPVSA